MPQEIQNRYLENDDTKTLDKKISENQFKNKTIFEKSKTIFNSFKNWINE